MRVKKILLKIASPILLIALLSMNVNAMTNFYRVSLPVGQLAKSIAKETKSINRDNPVVSVTSILKADGSSSDYQQIRCTLASGSETACHSMPIELNSPTGMRLVDDKFRMMGTPFNLIGFGNNPLLGCIVTGYFTAN